MSLSRKIVWSEGMFLQPQHFQQHDRYLQSLVEARSAALRPHAWGFTRLVIDPDQLALGKIAIAECAGVLPDGTAFTCSATEAPPPAVDIPEETRDELVVLALPLRRPGIPEAAAAPGPDSLARYEIVEGDVVDSNADASGSASVQHGRLRLRLALAADVAQAHAVLGVARVIERRPDNSLVLDRDYAPPCLDVRVAQRLAAFTDELRGLLHQRGDALAARLAQPAAGGVAEIQDFLLLQVVNRAEPVVTHLASTSGVHPESLYTLAAGLAGELATFSSPSRRPPTFPTYRHDQLKESFAPVAAELRRSLSLVAESAAVPIRLEERRYGLRIGIVAEPELYRSASFVLAVNAQLPAEAVRTQFPAQAKAGPAERIRDLVNLQLPGIPLRPLPVAPRQLPYHAGFTYFELDRASELWSQLANSTGFALHVAGEFPGLQLEL